MSEQIKFTERLLHSLKIAGFSTRATDVAKIFNRLKPAKQVTTHAARKWLVGESIPTQDKLVLLANWLNVKPEWLRFGTGDDVRVKSFGALEKLTAQEIAILNDLRMLSRKERELFTQLVHCLVDKSIPPN